MEKFVADVRLGLPTARLITIGRQFEPVGKPRHAVPLAAAILGIMALGPCFSTVAHAQLPTIPSSLQVAVGYADTEDRGSVAHSCADCFPDPWCGSPGVQFIGSSTNYNGNSTDPSNCNGGDWDGGGILVNNTGTQAITLTNLTVVLPLPASGSPGTPSCAEPPRPITFKLWFGQQYYLDNVSDPAYYGRPVTVPPGGEAIFAGTSSDGSYTCPTGNYPSEPPHATYDFDTSDANFLGGCVPTNDTVSDPRITFTAANYAPTTYVDVGHVIDTGGIDTGNCSPSATDPQWPHEYLGWRPVNSTCGEACPMNQLGPGAVTYSSVSSGESTSTPASASSAANSSETTPIAVVGTTSSSSGASARVEYSIAAVAVVLIVGIGYIAVRKRGKPG